MRDETIQLLQVVKPCPFVNPGIAFGVIQILALQAIAQFYTIFRIMILLANVTLVLNHITCLTRFLPTFR
jgi:hypothetical protein